MALTLRQNKHVLLWNGIFVGVCYGLVTRIAFGDRDQLPSIVYIFIVPIILGIIPLLFAHIEQVRSYRNILFIPWLTILTLFLTLGLMRIEDLLCFFVIGAPFLLLGTLGAFIIRFIIIHREKKKGRLLAVVVIPFLLMPVEKAIDLPSEIHHIPSTIIIDAPAEVVWENIVEVRAIGPEEYDGGLFNALGIPRPISASVDRKEVGGNRIGRFEGGLIFREVISHYELHKAIAFDIVVDPITIRSRVFDQHVLKGDYFSFVSAGYEMSKLSDGSIRLTLTSHYQLTSTINFYGKIWGDLILRDFQERLLEIIKRRCEGTKP